MPNQRSRELVAKSCKGDEEGYKGEGDMKKYTLQGAYKCRAARQMAGARPRARDMPNRSRELVANNYNGARQTTSRVT
jgi:hypothetical protein